MKMRTMGETYQTFKALPEDCNAFLGRMVPEEEADDLIKAYCDECERRHAFEPDND